LRNFAIVTKRDGTYLKFTRPSMHRVSEYGNEFRDLRALAVKSTVATKFIKGEK
jgi:hypothetical protein